ncbi:MAG: hypothetical protein WHX52_05525 [Anaerolineae bacterium]
MGQQFAIAVEDLTKKTPDSDLAVVVRFSPQNSYVEIFKNGVVRLISPAGVVNAQFKECDKRDWLRQSYIQSLLAAGVTGTELDQALQAIARVDRRLAQETDVASGISDLERRTLEYMRAWTEAQGLDYDALSEEEAMLLVQQGIAAARSKE